MHILWNYFNVNMHFLLTGNIERRQAGLLVGSCQGFASFHGEIDDVSI